MSVRLTAQPNFGSCVARSRPFFLLEAGGAVRGGPIFRAADFVTVCSTVNETDVANL